MKTSNKKYKVKVNGVWKDFPKNLLNRAMRLKRRLEKEIGGTWKLRLDWNLWYFFNLTCGTMSVGSDDIKRKPSYHCLIGSGDYPGTGLSAWTGDKYHTDIVEAVRYAMRNAKEYTMNLQKVIKLNESKIKT